MLSASDKPQLKLDIMAQAILRETARSRAHRAAATTQVARPRAEVIELDAEPVSWTVPDVALVMFTRQIATLLACGLPLLRGLSTLVSQQENATFRQVLMELYAGIASGKLLSRCMRRYPHIFPAVYVSMVRAGEAHGMLDESLHSLADYMEKEQATRARIRSVMAYPMVILLVSVLLQLFVVDVVLPQFIVIFESMHMPLPLVTRLLIRVVHVCQQPSTLMLLATAATAGWYGWPRLFVRPWARLLRDQVMLALPGFGSIVYKIAAVRTARTLAALLRCGVPLQQSIQLSAESSGNAVFRHALLLSDRWIQVGETLSDSLRQTQLFDPLFLHMVAIGEQTGQLDAMLDKIASYNENQVDHLLDTLPTLIEPLFITVLGCMVGAVLIAVFLPLYGLVTQF